jgi:peptidoglycan-N-acetylglucosamine deacetylase
MQPILPIRYSALALTLLLLPAATAPPPRPVLITVDDLPIAADAAHPDPAERERITRGMLQALAKHHVTAVGLVAGKHHPTAADENLLGLWLRAGHELGNHSFSHLNYSETETQPYIADVEKERAWLVEFLEARGGRLRFFRFPFLNEGNTPEKLRAMRDYLKSSGQTNLPVTLDNQDWSFEEDWVAARKGSDKAAMARIAEDYQAALRIHVEHFESAGERLFGRPTPEILLLHAGEVGAAQWDALFHWLEGTNHRFATADEVLADPAISTPHEYVAEDGVSLWERIKAERRKREVPAALKTALDAQVAAWNRGDLEAFVAIYAEDVSFIAPSGVAHGRQEVLERYRRRYPDRKAMGTLSLDISETRIIAGEEFTFFGDTVVGRVQGATVAARWTLAYEDKPSLTGSTLLVMRPRGNSWEILQDASM